MNISINCTTKTSRIIFIRRTKGGNVVSKANSYKLKDNITRRDLIELGFKEGNWQSKYKDIECVSKSIMLFGDINLNICIKTNPMEFDDYEDVLMLDDAFCQPYTPFYGDNYKKEIAGFRFLEKVIDKYNEAMDSFHIFKAE